MPEKKPFEGRANKNREFYVSSAWRKARKRYISLHPICSACGRAIATVVDHIIPINQGGAPLDERNFQSLCASCHNKKSGHEARGNR